VEAEKRRRRLYKRNPRGGALKNIDGYCGNPEAHARGASQGKRPRRGSEAGESIFELAEQKGGTLCSPGGGEISDQGTEEGRSPVTMVKEGKKGKIRGLKAAID